MHDRFWSEILLKIHHKLKWLDLEPTSLECILVAANCSNLYEVSLILNKAEIFYYYLDATTFTHIVKSILSSLLIDISKYESEILIDDVNKFIFTRIFTMFANLQYLHVGSSLMWYQRFIFNVPFSNVISSNLLELHMSVIYFTDLLYLLHELFDQFHTCHLYSIMHAHRYHELILPLLHRMLNLEQLDLQLQVHRTKGFIDGHDLKENIINYMSQ
ncbi:unnamed protein product [Rotaria magnacalcarata]